MSSRAGNFAANLRRDRGHLREQITRSPKVLAEPSKAELRRMLAEAAANTQQQATEVRHG